MSIIEGTKRARPFLCDNFNELYELIRENKVRKLKNDKYVCAAILD